MNDQNPLCLYHARFIPHAKNVDIMPANTELSGINITLINTMMREKVRKQYINSAKNEDTFILMDCIRARKSTALSGQTRRRERDAFVLSIKRQNDHHAKTAEGLVPSAAFRLLAKSSVQKL